jgi:hypothetical protein
MSGPAPDFFDRAHAAGTGLEVSDGTGLGHHGLPLTGQSAASDEQQAAEAIIGKHSGTGRGDLDALKRTAAFGS